MVAVGQALVVILVSVDRSNSIDAHLAVVQVVDGKTVNHDVLAHAPIQG